MAKGFFGLTFDGIRNNKDSIKNKTSSLKEKREGNNNPSKVYNLQKTHLQKIKGVLLRLP